jgi:protein CpxP
MRAFGWPEPRLFTRFYMPLTALYKHQVENGISNNQTWRDDMNPIKLACAGVLAMAVLGSAMAFGAGQEHRPPHDQMMQGEGMAPGRMGPMGMHGMDLSAAQRDKVFAIKHAQAPQAHELQGRLQKAHEALREMAHSGKLDEARATALSQEIGAATAAMALLHVRTAVQVQALLTPEQRKKMADKANHPHG